MLSRSSLNYIWHFWSNKSVGALLKNSSVKRESLWSLSLECPWNGNSERRVPAAVAISKKPLLSFYVFGANINQKAVNNLQECWTVTKLFMMKVEVIKYSLLFFFYSCKRVKLNKVNSTPIFCVSYFPSYRLIMMGKRWTVSVSVVVLSRILYCYMPQNLSQICT